MIVIYNAKIYTLDDQRPVASAIVIEDGRILAVGEISEILACYGGPLPWGARPHLKDAGGLTIIPGLTDAHIHLEGYALNLSKVDCETATRQECLRRVAERVKITPAGQWILGHGWNQNDWVEGFGSVADLDAISTTHPIYLTAKSLHAAWANSLALKMAGVNSQTPDPSGGKVGRDEAGNPTGILFETAMELVSSVIPEPEADEVARAIHSAIPRLWRMGVTGIHDFDRRRCFAALQILHQAGDLRLRVIKSIPLEGLPEAGKLGLRTGFGDDMLRIGSVKVFSDGALGPRTAAMLQPFEGEPDNRGILMMDAEELYEHGRAAVANGLSLAVHAIGDRANHEVLNAFTQLRNYERETGVNLIGGKGNLRHRIEHVQLIHADDAHRLAEQGIIASMQPIHAPSDMPMADRYWGKRSALAYAWRTQLEHGARLAFGSDAPVESPNPFLGLHAALSRRRADGSPAPEGWYPEQRLDMAQALRAYTGGPAFAAGLEDRLGKLAPGYLADMLILEKDPFQCAPDELLEMQPLATMIGGEWVWES